MMNAMLVARAACTVLALLAGIGQGAAQAQEVWQFVDGDGVVHIGNGLASGERQLTWLEGVAPVRAATPGRASAASSAAAASAQVKAHLESAALSHSVEPALVLAVAAAESNFHVDAVSPKGALGLMQVMPATAARYGVSADVPAQGKSPALDPKLNAQVGTRYLADLLRMFDGDKHLALAAYNAGEGAVLRHGRRVPPYPETQRYVEKVMRLYEAWR